MKRKMGPLQLWQWLAIGVAVGIGTYLYRRGHPAAAAAPSSTPADAVFNPIDPTTGLPYAGGLTTGAATDTTGTPTQEPMTLTDLLGNVAQVEDLFAGLQSLGAGPATNTSPAATSTNTGAKPAKPKKPKPKKPKKPTKVKHGGHANPGHHVTQHPGGRKSPSSSAPHNQRQHHNVAPPAHQRHGPTRHPSASGPGVRGRR